MSDESPGVEAWKAQTSAFDRVHAIATGVDRPRPASFIAAEAHVAENTARDHLERLVEMNILLANETEATTTYTPDPLQTRMQTLRDLLDEHDHDGLVELKASIQEQIESWREQYGVSSPEQLRERAAETEDAAETRSIRQIANDWELAAYRLSIVEDAIENYAAYDGNSRAPV